MFTPHIALIDDEIEQLNDIQEAFFSAGYPCLPIHYDAEDIDNESGIDHIKINFNPRIVVTDLNLRSGSLHGSDTRSLMFPIYKLLEKLRIDGPYILIFWSRIPDEVEQVMQLLKERFYEQINLPVFYTHIDKTTMLGSSNTPLLKEKINSIINNNDLFNAIIDWELRISLAATNTTNSLYLLTRPKEEEVRNENYQDVHTRNLKRVLASIGNEAIGVNNAKRNPEIALDTGLYPVLNDHLNNSTVSSTPNLWRNAVPEIGDRIELDDSLKTKLNTFYHIETVQPNYPKSCRGSFLTLSNEIITNEQKRTKIEKRLGQSLVSIIEEEFLRNLKPADMPAFCNDTILGFIEVSAECDQAQGKSKLHRYLLSALTPIKSGDKKIDANKFKIAHQGIYKLPDICIDNVDYILQCSFKYQIGSIPDENSWFGTTKFRVRDQVISELVFNFAHHISRPGIICFR